MPLGHICGELFLFSMHRYNNNRVYIDKKMSKEQLLQAFNKCENTLKQLKIALAEPMHSSRINIDATIRRFTFSIELMLFLLKNILEAQGKETRFPKEVLQEAYKTHLIDDETMWLNMLKDRNQTLHTYNQDLADEIYERIKDYYPILQATYDKLFKEFGR
jgi:nucleotidyltransferase substrate binding protein (TIGR01987 family)